MMGTFLNPASSSAILIAAIWPSIMPLGAMMSAPASAWETAVLPYSSMVSSFMT